MSLFVYNYPMGDKTLRGFDTKEVCGCFDLTGNRTMQPLLYFEGDFYVKKVKNTPGGYPVWCLKCLETRLIDGDPRKIFTGFYKSFRSHPRELLAKKSSIALAPQPKNVSAPAGEVSDSTLDAKIPAADSADQTLPSDLP